MNILFCCEFYYPSIGGVQVVMQHLAERLVERGHSVTIATTKLKERSFTELNGVKIKGFNVSGNFVSGIIGEVKEYRTFLVEQKFDVLMVKAAQQWTFDALWPVIDHISAVKIVIPCGFSGLYDPKFKAYFKKVPELLQKFDHLIFYATDYRDINFAKRHGIKNFSVLSNGACEREFGTDHDPAIIRKRLGIPSDDFMILTVGSFTGLKGHLEVAEAFLMANFNDRTATLILNGNKCSNLHFSFTKRVKKLFQDVKCNGLLIMTKHVIKHTLRSLGIRVGKEERLNVVIQKINKQKNKRVLLTDLPRKDLIQTFMSADLFAFSSNIEYSPLVLFESAAAGTPFLTVPVGNGDEIARWTGGGVVCPAPVDEKGYTRVNPKVFADYLSRLSKSPQRLLHLGATGKKNWRERYTWDKICSDYESLFYELIKKKAF